MKNIILSYKEYIVTIRESFESIETFIESLEIVMKQKMVNNEINNENWLKISIKDNNIELFENKTELLFDEYKIFNNDIYIPIINSTKVLEQRYDVELTGEFDVFLKLKDNNKMITENYISFKMV